VIVRKSVDWAVSSLTIALVRKEILYQAHRYTTVETPEKGSETETKSLQVTRDGLPKCLNEVKPKPPTLTNILISQVVSGCVSTTKACIPRFSLYRKSPQ
jgi:hypothetical protein